MESRKVQKVGYSTLTVSLPSEWVKQRNIGAGDLVFLSVERDGTLRILPSEIARKEEAEECVVNADAFDEQHMLERIIVGCYILGRDVVRITSSGRIEKDQVDEVRKIVRKLIGLGIIEETPKSILLQCSVDAVKFKIDMRIRRLSIIASTILSEAMQALLQKDNTLAKEAISREDEADTIYYLAVRLLLSAQTRSDIAEQIGATDIIFIPAMRLMLQSLELIADYSEDIAKRIVELQNRRKGLASDVVEKICHLGDLAQTVFQKAVDCVFSRDLTIANSVLEMKNMLGIESEEILRELPEVPYLRAIVISLNRIADMGGAIANIAVNRALQNPSKDGEKIFRMVKHVRTLPLPTKK